MLQPCRGCRPIPAITPLIEALSRAGLELREDPDQAGAPRYLVSGNTFAHRELLKRHGGSWDRDRQSWAFASPEPLRQLAAALPANGQAPQGGLADAPAPYAQEVRSFRALRKRAQNAGHRNRLRARFLEAGPEALPDYELLEHCCSSASTSRTPSRSPKSCWRATAASARSSRRSPPHSPRSRQSAKKNPEIDAYLAYRLSDDFARDQDAGPDDLSAAGRQMRARWKRPRRPIPARRRIGIGKRSGSGVGARP